MSNYLMSESYQIDLIKDQNRKLNSEFVKLHNDFRSFKLEIAKIKDWTENRYTELTDIPQKYELSSRHECHIYFIRSLDAVKIGYSANPAIRLQALQTANPNRLELLYSFPSLQCREKQIHEELSHLNIGGEWFKYNDEIRQYIKELQEQIKEEEKKRPKMKKHMDK